MTTADKSLARKAARARVTRRRRGRSTGKGGAALAGGVAIVLLLAAGGAWLWGWSGTDDGQLRLRTEAVMQHYHDGLMSERPPFLRTDRGLYSPSEWEIRNITVGKDGNAVVTVHAHATTAGGLPIETLVYFLWRPDPTGWVMIDVIFQDE